MAAFLIANFVLHLLWENLHIPLYEGYDVPFGYPLRTLQAAATGDMLFTLVIYACLALVHRDAYWLSKSTSYTHPATWVLSIVLGLLLAVSFELWAVYVAHRFAYDTMPVIPVLGVGLSPTLQMIVIPIISLIITRTFASSPNRTSRAEPPHQF